MRTSCADAPGTPWLLVALGTSETAGWGIRSDEPYSPQEAYPAQYADILCVELGVPVELHSYFPSQLANERAPLAWWSDKVDNDAGLRADLGAANEVALWALSSHDVVWPVLAGACRTGSTADVAACFAQRVGDIPAQTDDLFVRIADLVAADAIVLAADAYAPPFLTGQAWWSASDRDVVRQVIDPHFAVSVAAPAHGFIFVGTELVFNGPALEPPAPGLFQPDGGHPTTAGAALTASVFAEADGLGE